MSKRLLAAATLAAAVFTFAGGGANATPGSNLAPLATTAKADMQKAYWYGPRRYWGGYYRPWGWGGPGWGYRGWGPGWGPGWGGPCGGCW